MPMKEADKKKVAGKVFAFPAFTPAHDGRKVFFLFSVRQVVEVLRDVKILPVPFSSIGAEGVTEWRGRVVPVLSLEKFLGIKRSSDEKAMRTIAIRSVSKRNTDRHKELYAIITVGAKVEQLDLPLECDAVETPEWITDASYLIGAYKMSDRLLLVVDIEQILFASVR